MERIRSESPYAGTIGFSSSVRAGDTIHLAGVSAVGADGVTVGGTDPAAQAAECLRKIGVELAKHGASLRDVVHTRMYLTSADDWKVVGEQHARAFGEHRPAATMVVSTLIGDDMRVEMEAVAWLPA